MRQGHKRGAVLAAVGILVSLSGLTTACKTPSAEEIKGMVELADVQTKWVMKEYRQWPNPKLVLVPMVTFRVKNLSAKPLKFVNFNAIFKEKDAKENVGDNFMAAIRKDPIPPGELSPIISLKSNFGVEGRDLESFKTNPFWKPFVVKIFAVKGSHHVPMGEWDVSREIDFKEDQPPAPREKK
jgi:hypothetical protein